MQRAIVLQVEPTKSKAKTLRKFSAEALNAFNALLSQREGCSKFMEFHHKAYSTCKSKTSFNVQVVCSLIRDAWHKKTDHAKSVVVKFNIPRNCKTFSTKSKFFVELGTIPRSRVAIPIKKNGNFQRYSSLITDGWICKTYGLLSNGSIVAIAELHLRPSSTMVDSSRRMRTWPFLAIVSFVIDDFILKDSATEGSITKFMDSLSPRRRLRN